MQREDRYLVLKRADIEKYLTSEQRWILSDLAEQIAMGRALDGKRTDKQFACVADDWPEYEVVWKMTEERVDGTASPRSPGGSTADARRIAADILGEYAVLSHDGSFLNGEHYWVDAHELEKLIQSSIDSR